MLSSVALSDGSTQFVQWEQSRGRGYPSRLRMTTFEFTDRLGRAGDMSWVLYSTLGVGAAARAHRRGLHPFVANIVEGDTRSRWTSSRVGFTYIRDLIDNGGEEKAAST